MNYIHLKEYHQVPVGYSGHIKHWDGSTSQAYNGTIFHTVYPSGTEEWYDQDGQFHRDGDLPAVTYANGDKFWYQYGKLHRENDLPACEFGSGTKNWYQHGNLHREDKPAVVHANGYKDYWVNGAYVPHWNVPDFSKPFPTNEPDLLSVPQKQPPLPISPPYSIPRENLPVMPSYTPNLSESPYRGSLEIKKVSVQPEHSKSTTSLLKRVLLRLLKLFKGIK